MVRLDTRLDLGRRDLNKLLVMGYGWCDATAT